MTGYVVARDDADAAMQAEGGIIHASVNVARDVAAGMRHISTDEYRVYPVSYSLKVHEVGQALERVQAVHG